jgi:hypothetical protein
MAKMAGPGSARAMETWLQPFAAMFTRPSWLNAVALATGALLCLNRRTVCAALRAVDGAADKGFSRFHRLCAAQMAARCPGLARTVVELAEWRLIINHRGIVTLVPEPRARVPGLIWRLTPACEAALDRHEGVAKGSVPQGGAGSWRRAGPYVPGYEVADAPPPPGKPGSRAGLSPAGAKRPSRRKPVSWRAVAPLPPARSARTSPITEQNL